MKKHLTFKDNKSDKFWSIEVNGKSFTVTYGKTGTAGQTSTKDFDAEEKCMKEAKKMVNEKVSKGYMEYSASHNATVKVELRTKEEKGQSNESILSDDFRKYLKTALNDGKLSAKIKTVLEKYDFNILACDVKNQLIKYFNNIKPDEPVGVFTFFWDDSGSDCSIEGDYFYFNDHEEALQHGSLHNEVSIDFEVFFKQNFGFDPDKIRKEIADDDFTIIKKIIKNITIEVLRFIIRRGVLKTINMLSPFYVSYSSFHDEDAEIVYDSSKEKTSHATEEIHDDIKEQDGVQKNVIHERYFINKHLDKRRPPSPMNCPKFWVVIIDNLKLKEHSGKLGEEGAHKETVFQNKKELTKTLKSLINKKEEMSYYEIDRSLPKNKELIESIIKDYQEYKKLHALNSTK